MAESDPKGNDGETPETEESFAERMFHLVTNSHLCLSVAMGVHTGLFEAMSKLDRPHTAEEIAGVTHFKERYVREWLGAMVTGKIVNLSTESGNDKFFFPPHRHQGLIKTNKSGSSGYFSLSIPALARVFEQIGECFKKDGPKGVPYSAYSNLLWTAIGGMTEDRCKKTDIVQAVPGLPDALSKGVSVLEIGCGVSAFSLRIAALYPNSSVLATDFSDEALSMLKTKASDFNLSNVTIAKQDATMLPSEWSGRFDYIIAFDMVHDTAKPAEVLSGCHKVLKQNGAFIMIDNNMHTALAQNIGNPCAPMLYNFSLFNCMAASLYNDGAGLGAAWGVEKARKMIEEAGFSDIEMKVCPTEMDAMFICKKT